VITTLNPIEAREVLRNGHVGRLGCIANNEPYVVPVHYLVEDDCVYVHSLPGKKIEALRANPRACLQVDEVRDSVHWTSVLAYGNYEEIRQPAERVRALHLFLHQFPLLTPVESTVAQDAFAADVIVFRFRIDNVTGLWEG
jgi:nitroimidazol reductase NimA-like FMN-containing flavoprotein (pyridoxamine 5'-phosphate oxidase superfamily)